MAKALVWDLDVILCIGVWIGAPSTPSSAASIGSVCCGRVGLVGWGCGREGGGGWCEVEDMGEQRDDSRLDCAWIS